MKILKMEKQGTECWEKKNAYTDLEIYLKLPIFPVYVRSKFRAWAHGHRLTTIIFTELMEKEACNKMPTLHYPA